jgi:hypothetical protein
MPVPPKPIQPNPAALRTQFFQGQRDDVSRQANAARQQNDDLITRRMAAIGQSGSGAALGAQIKGREAVDQQRDAALGGIRSQEAGVQMQQAEADTGRAFQERLSDKDAALKSKFFDVENKNKLSELDLARQQFALDKDTTEFNKRLALMEAGKKGPGGVLGTGVKSVGMEAGKKVFGNNNFATQAGSYDQEGGK